MRGQNMTLYTSGYRGNERNAGYPQKVEISSVEDLRRAVAFDHVCAAYRNNHRAISDFLYSDCLMLDLDNTHSDNPADWKTLEHVKAAFPGVPFYAVESRNHMKPKEGKAPRPKYHLYFAINSTADRDAYALWKSWAVSVFPYFDTNAKDAARFFFGVESPKVLFIAGEGERQQLLDEYLLLNTTPPQIETKAAGTLHSGGERTKGQLFQLPDVIRTGERNSVLFKYGCQLRGAGCDREEITVLLNYQNEHRCDNPIEQSELDTIINSVCRYEIGRTATADLIEAAAGFKDIADATVSSAPLMCLADLVERSPEWLIEGYIPKKEITVMAGDGGVGKTFVWCAIAAAISSGSKPFLLNNLFPDTVARDPQKVMYFSSEDSNEAVLLPRLKASGAALNNIVTIDSSQEDFQKIKLNSAYLEILIATFRPALVIFDPLQSFLPPRADMSARNQMREAMAKLHVYGEKYGATFLIIMHTNKQQKVWGRTRLADSADIWDISRSVLICGEASERGSTRYLSQEKSSYGKTMQTVLFRIDGNAASFVGYTDKRDQQFVRAANKAGTESPERDAAEQFILEYLEENGECTVKSMDSAAAGNFISAATMRRAKKHLREQQKIAVKMKSGGKGKSGEWFVSLLHPPA